MNSSAPPANTSRNETREENEAYFVWPVRVYYEDTDAGGIVFYANYLKFFERARTEWLRACGINQQKLVDESGALFVVRSAALDYYAPARLDDEITIISRIKRLGRASIDFMQQVFRGKALLVSGNVRIACVEKNTIRPMGLPSQTLNALRHGPGVAAGPQ